MLMRSLLLLPLLVLALATTTAYAQTTKLKQRGAATTSAFLAPGPGPEPVEKTIAQAVSTGSLGKTHTSTVSELGPIVDFCDSTSVLVRYASIASIDTTANGDLLYRVMAESPPSLLCFNFVDESFTFEIHQVISGGTGRFAGASGHVVITGSGQNVVPGHSGASFELEGTIERGD